MKKLQESCRSILLNSQKFDSLIEKYRKKHEAISKDMDAMFNSNSTLFAYKDGERIILELVIKDLKELKGTLCEN